MRLKTRVLPEKLQKINIEKFLKKKFAELEDGLNPHFNSDDIIENIDWDILEKGTTYDENLNAIIKDILVRYGVNLSDEPDPRDLEEEHELKIFEEQLRIEFNKEGFDINSDDFGYLLETCNSLFGDGIGHVKSLSGTNQVIISGSGDVKSIKKIENKNIETIAGLLERKPQELKPKINL